MRQQKGGNLSQATVRVDRTVGIAYLAMKFIAWLEGHPSIPFEAWVSETGGVIVTFTIEAQYIYTCYLVGEGEKLRVVKVVSADRTYNLVNGIFSIGKSLYEEMGLLITRGFKAIWQIVGTTDVPDEVLDFLNVQPDNIQIYLRNNEVWFLLATAYVGHDGYPRNQYIEVYFNAGLQPTKVVVHFRDDIFRLSHSQTGWTITERETVQAL